MGETEPQYPERVTTERSTRGNRKPAMIRPPRIRPLAVFAACAALAAALLAPAASADGIDDLIAAHAAFKAGDYEACIARADAAVAGGGEALIDGTPTPVAKVAIPLRGGCRAMWGEPEAAIEDLTAGIDDPFKRDLVGEWLWARAVALTVTLRLDDALADLDRAIRSFGPSSDRLVLRCVANTLRDDHAAAEADGRAALAITPNDAAAELCLATALQGLGDRAGARALRASAQKRMDADDAQWERAALFRLVEY